MYDIGIIGAGPAGATLARLLADRYRVLLLNSGQQKCCGGILAERSQKVLAKLGLILPEQVVIAPQPVAVAIMDWDNHLFRRYARRYVNIDRAAFDCWLVSLIPPTVDIRNRAIYQFSERQTEGLTLHFTEKDEPQSAQVRWLVGADGAFSTVRREFFPNALMPKRYIAVQHWFERDAVAIDAPFKFNPCKFDPWSDYTGIFDKTLTDFYLWMIPKHQQLILGGAFPLESNTSATMEMVKEKLASLGLHLGTPFKREAAQTLRPLRQASLCFGDDRVILVGEASGLISPSSAEGISGALDSAFHLANAFNQSTAEATGFDPALYRRLLRERLWKLWFKKFRVPPMFNPLLRKCVMLSGLTALR